MPFESLRLSTLSRNLLRRSRRAFQSMLSVVAIASLLLSSMPLHTVQAAPPAQAEPTYRVTVTLKHPYDSTRLAQLDLTVTPTGKDTAMVIANEGQLATLARRGFEPTDIVAMSTLFRLAGAGVSAADLSVMDAPDSDGDGLTDLEEEWWCTDPHDSNSDSPLPPSETTLLTGMRWPPS
jgi:hypothetical protein